MVAAVDYVKQMRVLNTQQILAFSAHHSRRAQGASCSHLMANYNVKKSKKIV